MHSVLYKVCESALCEIILKKWRTFKDVIGALLYLLRMRKITKPWLLRKVTYDTRSGSWNVVLKVKGCIYKGISSIPVLSEWAPLSKLLENRSISSKDLVRVNRQLSIAEKTTVACAGPGQQEVSFCHKGKGRILIQLPYVYERAVPSTMLWKNTRLSIYVIGGVLRLYITAEPVCEDLSGVMSQCWSITATLDQERLEEPLTSVSEVSLFSIKETESGLMATKDNAPSSLMTSMDGSSTDSCSDCSMDIPTDARSREDSPGHYGPELLSRRTKRQRTGMRKE